MVPCCPSSSRYGNCANPSNSSSPRCEADRFPKTLSRFTNCLASAHPAAWTSTLFSWFTIHPRCSCFHYFGECQAVQNTVAMSIFVSLEVHFPHFDKKRAALSLLGKPVVVCIDGEWEGLCPFKEIRLFRELCKDKNIHVRLSKQSLSTLIFFAGRKNTGLSLAPQPMRLWHASQNCARARKAASCLERQPRGLEDSAEVGVGGELCRCARSLHRLGFLCEAGPFLQIKAT